MKKLISILLSLMLVLTSGIGMAYADKGGKQHNDKGREIREKMLEKAKDARERAKDARERAEEARKKAEEKAREAREKAKEKAKELMKKHESVQKSVYQSVYQIQMDDLKKKLAEIHKKQKELEKALQADIKALKSVYKSVYFEVYKDNIEALKDQLKELHKDAIKERQAMIKKIVALKKHSHKNVIPVFVNGVDIVFDVNPVNRDGRILIPVSAVTNALGSKVEWDATTKTVTVTNSVYSNVYGKVDTVISIKVDSKMVLANGQQVQLDVPAQIVSGRTMVPLRLITQILNKNVEWNKELGTVIIDD